MELINFSDIPRKYRPDILFTNRNEDIVLLVAIKAKKGEYSSKKKDISQFKTYWQNIKQDIHFGMLVDLNEISIFALISKQNNKESTFLKTNDILSTYDLEFNHKRIFDFYLETLVKSWLRDLSYHWHSETPPGYDELKKIGLLPLLEGGHTCIQENLGVDTLH